MIPLSATITCALLVGFLIALWERLPWVLSERLKMRETDCREWQSWFSLPLVVFFPVLGQISDRWDGQYILFFGILALAVSLAWLGQLRDVRSALSALLLLSAAIPCVVLPSLTILPHAFRSYKAVQVISFIFIGTVAGLLLTPPLIRLLVRRFSLRHGFLILALLCLVPALLVSLLPAQAVPSVQPRLTHSVFAEARCWLLALLAFVYYCLAELIGRWKKGYLAQADHDAPWVRLGFWMAVLIGLLTAGSLIWARYEDWGLATLAVIHAIVLGNLAGDFTNRAGTFTLWLAGATFAPILPALLAIHGVQFPGAAASAMGLTLGGGALGNFLFQPMLERFSQRCSVAATMRLAMLLTLVFAAQALVLALLIAVQARTTG